MPGGDHSKIAAVGDRGSFVELGTVIYSDGDTAMTRLEQERCGGGARSTA